MKLSKTMRKVVALVSAFAMVVAGMTGYSAKTAEAADTSGMTEVTGSAEVQSPDGKWSFYVGGAGGQEGKLYYSDATDTSIKLYIEKTSGTQWGIQVKAPVTTLSAGTEYQYEIGYTVEGDEGYFNTKEDISNSQIVKQEYTSGENTAKGTFTAGATTHLVLDMQGVTDDTTITINSITYTDDFEKETTTEPTADGEGYYSTIDGTWTTTTPWSAFSGSAANQMKYKGTVEGETISFDAKVTANNGQDWNLQAKIAATDKLLKLAAPAQEYKVHVNYTTNQAATFNMQINSGDHSIAMEEGTHEVVIDYTSNADYPDVFLNLAQIPAGTEFSFTANFVKAEEDTTVEEPSSEEEPSTDEPKEPVAPEGYTMLPENDSTYGGWKLYTGNWGEKVAHVAYKYDEETPEQIALNFVDTTANDEWLVQVTYTFTGLQEGTRYKYSITNGEEVLASGVFKATAETKDSDTIGLGYRPTGTEMNLTATCTEYVAPPTQPYDEWLTTERNLAYQKTADVSSYKEGNQDYAALTDGTWNKWQGNYVGINTPGYFEIDLGQIYEASSIDQVVVWFRNGDANLYPKNGFEVQFGDTVFSKVAEMTAEEYPEEKEGAQSDGSQYMVPVVLDKETVSGTVRKIRIQVNDSVAWGAQVTEIGVFAENPVEGEAPEPASNPKAVTVSSEKTATLTGQIKVNITADEGQEDYTYFLYLDEEGAPRLSGCVAGQDYTIEDVARGTHTVKVVSLYNGGTSEGLVSDPVEVKTIEDDVTDVSRNFALNKTWELSPQHEGSNEPHGSAEGNGDITNGIISDSDYVCPEKNVPDGSYIIDLGEDVDASAIENIVVWYRVMEPGCAPEANNSQEIKFSTDKDAWTDVVTVPGADVIAARNKQGKAPYGVESAISQEGTVRYIQIHYPQGVTYGAQVTEIAVIGNTGIEPATTPTETSSDETETPTTPVTPPYDPGFDPSTLEYSSLQCNDSEDLTLEYAVQESTIDGLNPWYGDEGNTLSLQFSGDAGAVTSVTINGEEPAEGVIKETATGLVKIDPTKLDDDAYSVIKVVTENGEFTFVVKKGTPAVVPPTSDEQPSSEDSSTEEPVEMTFEEYVGTGADITVGGYTVWINTTNTMAIAVDPTDADHIQSKIVSNNNNWDQWGAVQYKIVKDGLTPGQSYTISVDLKADQADGVIVTDGDSASVDLSQSQEVTLTRTVEADETGKVTLTIGAGQVGIGVVLDLSNLKITDEEGNVVYPNEDEPSTDEPGSDEPGSDEPSTGEAPTDNPTGSVQPTTSATGGQTTTPQTTAAPGGNNTTKAPGDANAKKPAKAKIQKVTAKKKSAKKIQVKIKKTKNAKGYQVAIYKTKKNAKKNKKALAKKLTKKTKVTITSKKLKNKKVLFIKVRAYNLNGKKKLFGAWSKAKRVKIKK